MSNFKYTIGKGINNEMPIESKLILLGQMHYAMERGDLTIKEVEQLEELLGIGIKTHQREMAYAVFGELDEEIDDRKNLSEVASVRESNS